MKKIIMIVTVLLLCNCVAKEITYPYGLTKEEWDSLSFNDQERLRRDYYFYENGLTISFDEHIEMKNSI